MKIKDIRKFRTFYKEKVREIDSTNRDEHFAGVIHKDPTGKNIYGFFDIYHGDKAKNETEGIRGFLEGFLDMARDAQAVYEFLQNAVDANSSHFAMFWGTDEDDQEDYLIVLNNGKQFDLPAVRSILNVGVSTKNPEEHTIGKFGIGFKLAHRLVGKDNGLDELIYENYGPILFSWKNNEIQHLANGLSGTEPTDPFYRVEEGQLLCQKDDPWLFKILITNFPCHPEETIINPSYQTVPGAFSKEELQKMKAWTKRVFPDLPIAQYQEGSLFFIRLGQGKKEHLSDANLEVGVQFSLAILNQVTRNRDRELNRINLNGKELESVQLDYVRFTIEKETEEYNWVRFGTKGELTETEKIAAGKDEDIHFLMGYTNFEEAGKKFENAPNFYLFFPLSEEKHRLKFILHCNAFYKASHRTSLHVGTEENFNINERLLLAFSGKLRDFLDQLAGADEQDQQEFLSIYANLLLSEESEDVNRIWINKPLVAPLFDYLQHHIPVRTDRGALMLESDPKKVKIKKTGLPLDTERLGLGFNWFYWSDVMMLHDPAMEKLQIELFTVTDLLKIAGISKDVNDLMRQDPALRQQLFAELEATISREDFDNSDFKENFYNLQFFSFEGHPGVSLNALAVSDNANDLLINFDKISPIGDLLKKVGFNLSEQDLTDYPNLLHHIRGFQRIKYINNYTTLNEVLSQRLVNNRFSPEDKWAIFSTLEKATKDDTSQDRNERMQVLKLFKNQNGTVLALQNLLQSSEIFWLKSLVIDQEEYRPDLDRYLVTDQEAVYDQVIQPLWPVIIEKGAAGIIEAPIAFYEQVIEYYECAKVKNLLGEQAIFFSGSAFMKADENIFCHQGLKEMKGNRFEALRNLFEETFHLQLPCREIIEYLQKPPFNLANSDLTKIHIDKKIDTDRLTVLALVRFSLFCQFPLFEHCSIAVKGETSQYQIRPKAEQETVVLVGEDPKMTSYIHQYHSELCILPPDLHAADLIEVKDRKLVEYLISRSPWDDADQSSLFMAALRNKGEEVIKLFLEHLPAFPADMETGENFGKLQEVVRLALPHHDSEELRMVFANSILVSRTEGAFWQLSECLGLGTDSVSFGKQDEYQISISDIFSHDQHEKMSTVNGLINRLSNAEGLDLLRLRNLFGITATVEKSDLLERVTASVEQHGHLQKAAQLAFVLLYKAFEDPDLSLREYHLLNGEVLRPLTGTLAVDPTQFPFFAPDSYLHECYRGVAKLLRLTADRPRFRVDSVELFLFPAIEDRRLMGPHLTEIAPSEQITFLDLLLSCIPGETRLELAQKNWMSILGFNPSLTVVHTLRQYENESLPGPIFNWFSQTTDESKKYRKKQFLKGLGVNFGTSAVVRLRRSLLNPDEEVDFEVREFTKIVPRLLLNTLQLLADRPYFSISEENQAAMLLIKEMIKQLLNDDWGDLLLPLFDVESSSYRLHIPDPERDYYWDKESAVNAYQFGVTSAKKLAGSISGYLYDAQTWVPSSGLKTQLKKIALTEQINTEMLTQQAVPWEKPFYKKYCEENETVAIFQIEKIPFQIFLDGDHIEDKWKEEVCRHEGCVYVSMALSDSRIMELIGHYDLMPEKELNRLGTAFSDYKNNIQQLLESNIATDRTLQEKLELIRKEVEQANAKKQLKERLEDQQYTYQWFQDFMQLHALQEQRVDNESPEKEIFFFDFEKDPQTDRLIVLKDPNRTITPTIEYCVDFHATFIRNNGSRKEVKIQGVSKKGQRLWALVADPHDLSTLNPKHYKRIELRFSRSIDLLERLRRAFTRLGQHQEWSPAFNLKEELPLNTNFIFGPPGTGKTTTIARRIIGLMQGASADLRIIVLTPTNKAADVLTEKIMDEAGEAPTWLVRYGAAFSNKIIENDLLMDANSFALNQFSRCVLITTIHRYPYEEVLRSGDVGDKSLLCAVPWDYVIFDEASMIPLNYMVFSMYQSAASCEKTRFIIGGDPFQIPPVVDIPDEDLPDDFNKEENIYTMIGLDTFQEEEQRQIPRFGDKITNLTTQYRSIEPIGELFSHFSYHGLLKHGRNNAQGGPPNPRPLPSGFQELGFQSISLVRFPVNSDDSIYRPAKLKRSPYHVYSALLILELIRKLEQSLEPEEDTWTVGVICPYRSQATLMNKMVESLSLSPQLQVITDTVHGFQGDQCDIVFFLLSPSNHRISRDSRLFLHKDFLINVAISRARDHLFIFYPDDATDGIQNLRKVKNGHPGSIETILQRQIGLNILTITLQASDLEAALFGEDRHIEENVFTNKHQMVNVYAKAEKKYLVREDAVAVDVQFRPED